MTGSTTEFDLETRIFHSLCVIAIIALGYNVPFNYIIGLPLIAFISLISLFVFIYLFYRSRYQGKVRSTFIIFSIVGNLLFATNFIYNSGTYGPTDMLMGLCILLTLCVSPKGQQHIWMWVNIAVVLCLHLLEYYYPHLIPDTYDNRQSRYLDITSAYIVLVIVVHYTVTYMRRNYDHEKQSSVDKAAAIGQKNLQITIQNQDLERINSERNKLMSIIAHDLR